LLFSINVLLFESNERKLFLQQLVPPLCSDPSPPDSLSS
jgi:hypothetical protein